MKESDNSSRLVESQIVLLKDALLFMKGRKGVNESYIDFANRVFKDRRQFSDEEIQEACRRIEEEEESRNVSI